MDRLVAVPTVLLWLPGLVTVTVLPPPPPPPPPPPLTLNAPVPFGVPSPVGPSQPGAAVHSSDGQHVPLLPLVTSFRLPVFAYGHDDGLSVEPGVPASAYTEATIGAAALVPP